MRLTTSRPASHQIGGEEGEGERGMNGLMLVYRSVHVVFFWKRRRKKEEKRKRSKISGIPLSFKKIMSDYT